MGVNRLFIRVEQTFAALLFARRAIGFEGDG